jgi:hypothetical protein
MNVNLTFYIHRVISVIALLQTCAIVFGTFFVMAALKASGHGIITTDADYSRAVLFVRNSGWTLLLIPVCWGSCAGVFARLNLHPWLQRLFIILGLAAVVFGVYAYIAIASSTRRFW